MKNITRCLALSLSLFCITLAHAGANSDSEQFEYGKPNKFLDASDWFWPTSLIGKAILTDRKVDSHQISPTTVEALDRYIKANGLGDMKVRVNQYDPKGEWRRLRANKKVGAGWRYTLGVLSWVGYTILPGRVIGGDSYNPFTHTINLYSDIPVIALHEGGHGKDFRGRKYTGTHAAAYILPFAPLYYEARASKDVFRFLRDTGQDEQYVKAHKTLAPAYGTYVGGATGEPLGAIVGAIGGQIVGRINAHRFEKKQRMAQHFDNINLLAGR